MKYLKKNKTTLPNTVSYAIRVSEQFASASLACKACNGGQESVHEFPYGAYTHRYAPFKKKKKRLQD